MPIPGNRSSRREGQRVKINETVDKVNTMRGNPRNQSGQIFRALDRIGQSRHAAKQAAQAAGIIGSHNTSQALGVFSFSTMTKYRAITTQFLRWCRDVHGVKDAAKVTPDHVQEWLQVKIASGVRYKTFATYAAALGKMSAGLNAIYKRGDNWTTVIDETRVQARENLERTTKSRGFLNPDILCDSLQGVYRIAAQVQYHGGARVKEITHLTDKHLLGNNTIQLTNTKGGRLRVMELPPELYEQVAEIIRQDGEFRFQYRTYLRHLKAAALETGQPYNGSHGLRWNFAQRVVQDVQKDGLSYDEALKVVSERMGHSRKEITEHYLQ